MRALALLLLLALAPVASTQEAKLDLVEIRELPLGEAVPLLSELTGLKIVASGEARRVPVSLYLRDVAPRQALSALCRAHGLWFSEEASGIILIRTATEYRKDLSSFREEQTKVFTLLYPNALTAATAIRDLFGARVQLSTGGEEDDEVQDDLESRFDRFELIDRQSQGLGIFESAAGAVAGDGGGSSVRDSRDRDTRRSTDRRQQPVQRQGQDVTESALRGLSAEQIQALERADPEALTRLLRGRTTIYVTVIRPQNQLLVRTADETTMQQIERLVLQIDRPTPMVLLEVKVLSLELGDDFTSVFDFQFTDRGTLSGGFTTGALLPPPNDGITGTDARKAAPITLGGTGLRSGDMTFQYVDENFRARLQMLENDNRVTALATPLLLTANNEVSRLFVGEERPLNRGFTGPQTVVDANNQLITTPGSTAIEFRPVGTTLLFTPTINADRTVTIRIIQENSSISPNPARVLVPSSTGFVEQLVDVVQARTLSGTVVAKDGLALALGGLIEETLVDSKQQVPILGRLPVLSFFFSRKEQGKSRRELVIVVRPYVLTTPGEGARRGRMLLNELSLHPNAPAAHGTLNTYRKGDALRTPRGAFLQRLRPHGLAGPGIK